MLASNPVGIISCLKASVSNFWSGELNEVVDQNVVVDPVAADLPSGCAPAIAEGTAFVCQTNDTVYITKAFVALMVQQFGAKELPYALASVVSHEIGHVVQAAVKQPGYDNPHASDEQSRTIEQQADCLSGVWAFHEAQAGLLRAATFETVAVALITDVSDNPEIQTHGSPEDRKNAISIGLEAGRPQDCSLATFS